MTNSWGDLQYLPNLPVKSRHCSFWGGVTWHHNLISTDISIIGGQGRCPIFFGKFPSKNLIFFKAFSQVFFCKLKRQPSTKILNETTLAVTPPCHRILEVMTTPTGKTNPFLTSYAPTSFKDIIHISWSPWAFLKKIIHLETINQIWGVWTHYTQLSCRVASAVHGCHPGLYRLAISTCDSEPNSGSEFVCSEYFVTYVYIYTHWLAYRFLCEGAYIYYICVYICSMCYIYHILGMIRCASYHTKCTYLVPAIYKSQKHMISETPLIPQLCLALGILAIAPLQHTSVWCLVWTYQDLLIKTWHRNEHFFCLTCICLCSCSKMVKLTLL